MNNMVNFYRNPWLPQLLLFCSASAVAQQDFINTLASQQLIKSGREVFVHNCAGCHGTEGKGDGPASNMLNPRPRNLVSGSFKFRTTPTGSPPVLSDLIRTIDQGVLGTSMPSFRLMSQQEKLAVSSYIMSLRPDWGADQEDPVFIPRPPQDIFDKKENLLASAQRGHELFLQACQTCHGDRGLGDGPSAAGLMDGEEQPIVPANLQKKWIKSGRTPSDIFKAISTGLDGTPMPGFGDVFTDEQKWDLVAFVFYMRGVGSNLYSFDDLLKKSTTGKAQ